MGLGVIVKKYLNDKYNNFKQIEWVERGGGFKFSRPMNFVLPPGSPINMVLSSLILINFFDNLRKIMFNLHFL